ncbi:MAG: glycosyltransferase family 2 protein [Gammaproteobacteria bacterium]
MATTPKLAVLLSTYNGGKFLKEQLDSLLGQTYSNFVVVVRDDGSMDDSLEILQAYAAEHPDRFHLVNSTTTATNGGSNNLGACGSFSLLMDYVLQHKTELGLEPAYMLFCDQDDVWFENKIERELKCMLETEAQLDHDAPVLVHSDLAVVSENRELIANSFTRYQGLETERNSFCNLAISNLVTGCTALINEAAARKALPIPEGAIMHDWWLGLVAAGFGQIVFIDAPLVHYRQHGSNTIGAKEHQQATLSDKSFLNRLLSLEPNEHLFEVAEQAAAFLERHGGELAEHEMRGLLVAARMKTRVGLLQRMHFRRARRY